MREIEKYISPRLRETEISDAWYRLFTLPFMMEPDVFFFPNQNNFFSFLYNLNENSDTNPFVIVDQLDYAGRIWLQKGSLAINKKGKERPTFNVPNYIIVEDTFLRVPPPNLVGASRNYGEFVPLENPRQDTKLVKPVLSREHEELFIDAINIFTQEGRRRSQNTPDSQWDLRKAKIIGKQKI